VDVKIKIMPKKNAFIVSPQTLNLSADLLYIKGYFSDTTIITHNKGNKNLVRKDNNRQPRQNSSSFFGQKAITPDIWHVTHVFDGLRTVSDTKKSLKPRYPVGRMLKFALTRSPDEQFFQNCFPPISLVKGIIGGITAKGLSIDLGNDMSEKTINKEATQAVSFRQWIRLVVVYLLIPLILFLCGGDLGWWQAWLYSMLILTAGIGGRILAEQRHPGITAERQNIENFHNAKAWDKLLAPLMAVSIGFPMVIVAGVDHRCNWSPEFPLWLNVIGFIFITFGYAFATWAIAENRFFSGVVRIQTERGHVVCDSGPYRFIRHPGYAGNILPLFGLVFALGSVWTLIPAAVAVIITLIRTRLEDQTLMEELQGYRDYAQRVRYRLFPGLY